MLNYRIGYWGFFHIGPAVLATSTTLKGFPVIVNDPDFSGNKLDFCTDKLFTDRYQFGVTLLAETIQFFHGT